MKSFRILKLAVPAIGLLSALCIAVPQQKNEVKGQEQLSGSIVKFGTVYSLQNHFNIAVYSAKYTVEPFECYGRGAIAKAKSKLIVFDLAIKNAAPKDNFFNAENMGLQVVDDKQNVYGLEGCALQSKGNEGFAPTLKPGQGMGQPSLNDPLRMAFLVPGDAIVTKLIIGVGRLNTSEKVLRYQLVPKATATNKNAVAPLPEGVHDPADPTGAIALAVGKATLGQSVPSGPQHMSVDDVSSPDGVTFKGQPAPAGKRYIVAKMTVKQMLTTEDPMFYVIGANDGGWYLKDADGDTYGLADVRKASSDDDCGRNFKLGDQYTFRAFFLVPNTVKPVQLYFAHASGRQWAVDLPSSK